MHAAYREVMLLRVAGAKKQQLTQTQHIFEQREKTGRLLAWLAKEQQPVTAIARLRETDGTLVMAPVFINARFVSYYSTLYSKADYSEMELDSFLDQIFFQLLLRRPVPI